MGLALNSDEVQRNLALVPVGDNVSVCVCPGDVCPCMQTSESVDVLLQRCSTDLALIALLTVI